MNIKRQLYGLAVLGAIGLSTIGVAKESEHKSTIQGTLKVDKHTEPEFPGLAKISLEDAMRIATENVKGKVLQAGLDKENGYLIYAIEVVTPEKEMKELAIDAVSGKVLSLKLDKKDSESEEDDD